MSLDVKVSKTMSYYLRHHLDAFESRSEDGYVAIAELLSKKEFRGVTEADIKRLVAINEKQRFVIDGDRIRASQGHSGGKVATELLLKRILEPRPYCAHGTDRKSADIIKLSGLNRMGRDHIHMAASPHAKSGFRASSRVLVHVNMAEAMADGIEFYESDNGVILSSGIDGRIDHKYLSFEFL